MAWVDVAVPAAEDGTGGLCIIKPEAGSRKPEAGSRKPEAGSRAVSGARKTF